ncbi:MAG: o-succinylbenzoate synthase [Bacteroidetes bacterium]|nr:o-succinylbenzoate synthase [Bacteroidota bacterium]
MIADYRIHDLNFKVPARTSRNTLETKRLFLLRLKDKDGKTGFGEISPFTGLSLDDSPEFKQRLDRFISDWNGGAREEELDLNDWPSIRFGLETALLDLYNGGRRIFFDGPFCSGKESIPINGLIWMDSVEEMLRQIEAKIDQGFNCIKMKIGALDFDQECRMLEEVRKHYSAFKIELRVDANGAFPFDDALAMLKDLSRFELHSIEQPIQQGHWERMAELCAKTPLPIALDEELLGLHPQADGDALMRTIHPQFLILKPGLLGGFKISDDWISLARKYATPWWITSALESNLGLAAIAQYTATKGNSVPQGLGTGQLYTNNFPSPLQISNGYLSMNGPENWNLDPDLLK